MSRRVARRSPQADSSALERGWGAGAAREARHRIAAATERQDLAAITHWTRVWFELMRVADARRLAA